ncbi:MAG TPA: SDR family NAD(P)-dependent oxidoreductase, partial [Gemmataceae bacterium]|nr:SDR family NAD(P)-dependent oxidoreductase [Gemmataceae bacterium]
MADAFFRLDGRVAVVTGGGQGIGEAICRRLAGAGARAAVFDMSAENANRVAKDIGGLA